MSGPKVVRIVTPEERRIIKGRCLSHLSQAILKIEAYAKENGYLSEDLKKGLAETLRYYESLSEDEYQKIEREIPGQINYLEEEYKGLKKRVLEIRTSDWNLFKNLKITHDKLSALLSANNIQFEDFPQPKIISKEQLKSYQAKVDGLYDKLVQEASTNGNNLSEEQINIQKRLSEEDNMLSVTAWRSHLPEIQSRLRKLEKSLEEMYANDISQEKIQALLDRCINLDENEENFDVQLDSIILDAADFSKKVLALKEAREKLSGALQLIETLGTEFNFIPLWQEKLKSVDVQDILQTSAKAQGFYKQISEGLIVEAKRKAIRSALEKAGYEITETMETAWVENGRLVVKKASNSLYGVEFMSPQNLSRIQARVVADEQRSKERSPSLDKNQEEIWCGDFNSIRSYLKNDDQDIIIDKKEDPGAVKLKEVPLNSGYDARKQIVKNNIQR